MEAERLQGCKNKNTDVPKSQDNEQVKSEEHIRLGKTTDGRKDESILASWKWDVHKTAKTKIPMYQNRTWRIRRLPKALNNRVHMPFVVAVQKRHL